MDVRIRTAVPDDETRIRELFLEMLHSVFPGQDVNGYEEGYLDRFWAGQDGRIYVAEDEEVVAFLSIEVHDDPVRYVYLDDFSVSAGYRNKGIGTALIRKAAEELNSKGLTVFCTPSAAADRKCRYVCEFKNGKVKGTDGIS